MATATKETIVPRKKQTYNEEIRPRLKDELELSTVMQVPSISKNLSCVNWSSRNMPPPGVCRWNDEPGARDATGATLPHAAGRV